MFQKRKLITACGDGGGGGGGVGGSGIGRRCYVVATKPCFPIIKWLKSVISASTADEGDEQSQRTK